jgi:hypothetical protein
MTGRRAKDVLEIRADIEGRTLLGIKPLMGRVKCLTYLFVGGLLNLKPVSSKSKMLPAQVVLQQQRRKQHRTDQE